MNSLKKVLNKQGLEQDRGLFLYDKEQWESKFSYSIETALKNINPDAFFYSSTETSEKYSTNYPFILFFDNPAPDKEEKIFKQVWNFNQAPIIFIIKPKEILIYNGVIFDKKDSTLRLLEKFEDFREQGLEQFSFWNIQSGQLWKKYENEFNDKRKN